MSNTNKKDAIGKGIRSLLESIDSDLKTGKDILNPVKETITNITRIPVDEIEINPKQPRRDFDEQSLEELARSISMHDLIQPVTVARIHANRFRLIAGERRWRASRMAGLKDIPAYIRQANDQQLLELALLENLQREDLNAIEIALSYKRLMEELDYSQEQVAERMGKDRTTVTNYIRLLKLPPDIQLAVRTGQISMGHARALINVSEIDKQLYIFQEIEEKDLSVRQTENLVRKLYKGSPVVKKTAKSPLSPAFKRIEDNLASHFSTRATLKHSSKGTGSITLEYYSEEELNSILNKMNVRID